MRVSEDNIIGAIKDTKEYISNLSNVCKSCENRDQVYFWTEATDKDIESIKDEIERAYQLALERCTGKTEEARWSIYDIIRAFEKTCSREKWKIYPTTPRGSGLIENKKDGIKYYVGGWDSTHPISLSKIYNKSSITKSKGKIIDKRILLARHFSGRVPESTEKDKLTLKNTVLIDLGFRGERRGDITTYGDLDEYDPFVHELVVFIEKFCQDSVKFTQLIERPERERLDTYLIRHVLQIFEDNFRILDCGHLKVMERRRPFGMERRKLPFEERIKEIGLLYIYPSEGAQIDDLKNARQKLIDKIDQLYQSEFVTTTVKRDIDGGLCKNEIRMLCKACEETYLNKYEVPLLPCGGQTCIFKHFLTNLAEQISYDAKYVEPYELGLLFKGNDVIVVGRTESVMHPVDNITLFKPGLFIVLDNFLSTETVEAVDERGHMYLQRRPQSTSSKSDPTAIAYEYAKNYLLPTIVYDYASDEYGYVPIETKQPSMRKMIKTIISIDYTVGATERAYKAPHDRIVDLYEKMGLEFGFNPVKEYRFGTSRLDVVWLDRQNEEPKVGIEVELSGQITSDLWKLCELQPFLGVLVVKGSYYDAALDYVTRSNIVKKFNQRVLVFDASEKNYCLIEGSKLVDLTDVTDEDAKN